LFCSYYQIISLIFFFTIYTRKVYANNQAVLTYNQQGILIKEEIKSNNIVISTLTLIEKESEDNLDFELIALIIVIISVAVVGFLIGIIFYKKSR